MTRPLATGLPWTPRAAPLPVGGAAGRGPVARRLAERLLALDDAALGRLEGVAGPGLVVAWGEVPWVDGLDWLGQHPDAPALWLPTALDPGVPVDLLQQSVLRRTGGAGPVVLLPDLLVPVDPLPIDRRHLRAWSG